MKIKEVGYKTDTGKVREENEDYAYVDDKIGFFIVADGMGGHQGGAVASEMAVKTIVAFIKGLPDDEIVPQTIQQAVQDANRKIYSRASNDPNLNGMGTTIVLALCQKDRVHIAHVGNSRAYLIRSGEIKRLTQDHSVVAELLKAGKITEEDARNHHLRHVITKALGNDQSIEADIQAIQYQNGDRFLLCSDGLTDMMTDEKIRKVIISGGSSQKICEGLVRSANKRGGKDNITVVLVRFD